MNYCKWWSRKNSYQPVRKWDDFVFVTIHFHDRKGIWMTVTPLHIEFLGAGAGYVSIREAWVILSEPVVEGCLWTVAIFPHIGLQRPYWDKVSPRDLHLKQGSLIWWALHIPNCCWSNHVNPPEVFVLLQTKYKKLRNNPKVVAMLNPTIPTSIFRIYGAKYCFLWFPEGFLLGVWENCFSLGQKRWAPGRLAMAWRPAGRIWVCHQAGRQVGDIYRSTASLNGLWLVVTLW